MMSYANPGNQYNQYRQQSAMTASPGELTLMLYDGCIKFLKLSILHMEEKDLHKVNENSKKAQAILDELIRTLDLHYPVGEQLLKLYDYILQLVIDSNLSKNAEKAQTAIELISDLRDTWQQAVKIHRQSSLSGVRSL